MSNEIVQCGRCGAGNAATRAVCYRCEASLAGAQPWTAEVSTTSVGPAAASRHDAISAAARVPELRYADTMSRVLALLWDIVVLTVLGVGVGLWAGVRYGATWYRVSWGVYEWLPLQIALPIMMVGAWLYFAGYEWAVGGTPGKLFFHCQVTDLQGRKVSFWRASWRFGLKVLTVIWSVVMVAMLWGTIDWSSGWQVAGLCALPIVVTAGMVAFGKQKQAIHDVFAGTVVVQAGATEESP